MPLFADSRRAVLSASRSVRPAFKLPLLLLSTLSLNLLFSYLTQPFTNPSTNVLYQPLGRKAGIWLAYKVSAAVFFWISGADANEATFLTLLSLAPKLHYLYTYHPLKSRLPVLALSTLSDLVSIYLPILFLRPHADRSSQHPLSVRLPTHIFAAAAYQLLLHVLDAKFLTSFLLSDGWELADVRRVHDVPERTLLERAALLVPVGAAATEVLRRRGLREVAGYEVLGALAAGGCCGGGYWGSAALAGVWVGCTGVVAGALEWIYNASI